MVANTVRQNKYEYTTNMTPVVALGKYLLYEGPNTGAVASKVHKSIDIAGAAKIAVVATAVGGNCGTISLTNLAFKYNTGTVSTSASIAVTSPAAGESKYAVIEKSGALNEVVLCDNLDCTFAVGAGTATYIKVELVFFPLISE